MTYLARVLIIFVGLMLLARLALSKIFGSSAGSRPQARRKSGKQKSIRGQTFKDPHCGIYVASSLAVSHEIGGKELYFCSTRCRDEYLAEQLQSKARSA